MLIRWLVVPSMAIHRFVEKRMVASLRSMPSTIDVRMRRIEGHTVDDELQLILFGQRTTLGNTIDRLRRADADDEDARIRVHLIVLVQKWPVHIDAE